MKKVLSVLLVVLLSLSLFACKGADKPEESASSENESVDIPADAEFKVGFARNNCMPDEPVPLQGYGNVKERMSTGFLDYLTISCTAITDKAGSTLLMFTVDVCGSGWSEDFRKKCETELGVPYDHITVTATHTHSSVATGSTEFPSVVAYNEKLKTTGIQTAKQALEDQAKATMSWNSVDLTGYNFIRHYVLTNGEVVGDNFGDDTGDYVGHSTEENPTMNLIRFDREGDLKDIYFANWRVHPHITGGSTKYDISADWPAIARQYIEKETNSCFGYYNGDAGNSNPFTRIASEGEDGITNLVTTRDYKKYGQKVGDKIIAVINGDGWETVNGDGTGLIKTVSFDITLDINHTEDEWVDVAREVSAYWKTNNDKTGAMALAAGTPIRSVYHADGIVSKASSAATTHEVLYALCIGDELGFACAPNEIFVENGNFVREKSPFKYTVMMGYTNGHNGYIPSQAGYDYHCYEMCTTKFAPGSGEIVADKFVELLEGLIK